MVNNEDKMKALDAAISNIEKQFGKGSVMKLGDSATNMNVECIPTGSLSLDIALGLGGVPKMCIRDRRKILLISFRHVMAILHTKKQKMYTIVLCIYVLLIQIKAGHIIRRMY